LQKCWAHLLRKAIKLTLLEPTNVAYREFADRLLETYRTACRVQGDGRLGDAGRTRKVVELDDAIVDLCVPMWGADLPPLEGPADDYRLLCDELMRLMLARQLFTFVTAPPVETPTGAVAPVAGTNNEAERTLRDAALARKTGRTNKTPSGARRQTIIVSLLESLRCHLPTFTLTAVIDEIQSWFDTGQSCFDKLLAALHLTPPDVSLLDRVLPVPSG
jgi:transposase